MKLTRVASVIKTRSVPAGQQEETDYSSMVSNSAALQALHDQMLQ